jgi:hypothetical protein
LVKWRDGEFEECVQIPVDVDVTSDVCPGESELAGVGEHPREGIAAKDFDGDVIGGRTYRRFGDTAVVGFDSKRQFVGEN